MSNMSQLSPDSARAKKSRAARINEGGARFDCIVSPEASQGAVLIMESRNIKTKTELLEKLISEEKKRIQRRGRRTATQEGRTQN
jgi:hypothetical protein